MSKFFVILVEDLGDENFKFFRDPDRFLANTKVELPTECEIRGCTEISGNEALRIFNDKFLPIKVRPITPAICASAGVWSRLLGPERSE